jgi:tetratricopeptide (TPR) repeat protein
MAGTLTPNEEAQLAQTIEMFEVITQSQPLDYASLEILKEAYLKLGRQSEVVQTAKRIAEAYVHLGQLSSAILEYESILQQYPDDPDVKAALDQIENQALSIAVPSGGETEFASQPNSRVHDLQPAPAEIDDGRKTMHKIFVDGRLIGNRDFEELWPTPGMAENPSSITEPFIQLLADRDVVPIERSLRIVSDRSRLPFLHLDQYDIDADLARSFPRSTCLRWCVLPFDRMSKSVLVATANPFNRQAAWEIETETRSRLVWFLTQPAELVRMIRKLHR